MPLIPPYTPPDFSREPLASAPVITTEKSPADGVAPENFHATSNHPEYVHVRRGSWVLIEENRMDTVIRMQRGQPEAVEARRLKKGDEVVVGRGEEGEKGVYIHTEGFDSADADKKKKFAFMTRGSRETPFSRSYDHLYEVLRHEKEQGFITWVLGPAVAFDRDSRKAMADLIKRGYCHALLAGNALATHDMEAGLYGTGLGQDIYTREIKPLGHYHHLDLLNKVRRTGSIPKALAELGITDGIIHACDTAKVPYVLAGSIRDDGPLPEVITRTDEAQDRMREVARKATCVITLATQLHTIAFGNMTPSYRVLADGTVRPVFFYVVDISEFSVDKLANRGSAQSTAILTNVQDFMINLSNNLNP
ncbi:hypothetical protein [Desulfoluna sp.]|uniref:ornithine cyclodeaminase family domain n=1 Tax=Desulfoluna sp. TaxID=2045199 RepID=UPI002619B834|nr:hypothetical protein [Desulfoluna sp.]